MTLLQVRDLAVRLRGRTLVSDIDLDLASGESLALVGESGSGKSITARAILGILPPGLQTSGKITIDDVVVDGKPELASPLRGSVAAMLMQDPFTMLNPLRRIGPQLADSLPRGARKGEASRRDIAARLKEVDLDRSSRQEVPLPAVGRNASACRARCVFDA